MKKTALSTVLVILLVLLTLTGCATTEKKSSIGFTVIGDHVIELDTITDIDFEKGLEYFETNFGAFGCTAVGKVISNGDMIIGRSYDLEYSNAPAYIVKTAIPGHYKTIGVAYNAFTGTALEDIEKNGISEDELLTIYCMTGDVLNEKGFYIEANMRDTQPEETGIKECSGTNPGAEVRLSFATLLRYLGERAATVDEALEIAYSLDVYGFKTETISWGGGIFMADATGHYGVLELVDNKLVWNDMQPAQANFYLSPDYIDRAEIGMGLGRYETVMEGREAVDSEEDMRALITKVRYFQSNDPDNCIFDPISELTGTVINGKRYLLSDIKDESNREFLMSVMREGGKAELEKSVEQMRNEKLSWVAAYQTVVNCNKRTLSVVFFEDDTLTYSYSL